MREEERRTQVKVGDSTTEWMEKSISKTIMGRHQKKILTEPAGTFSDAHKETGETKAASDWYVVQTLKGREEKALSEILDHVKDADEQAFIMENEKLYKHQGKWHGERENLFPGYLFVVTRKPEEFDGRLRRKHSPLKLMRFDDVIRSIEPEEEDFLMRLGGDDHVVKYSEGFQIGDRIVIEKGSLKGFEGEIRQKDRHNRQAKIAVSMFGRKMEVTVALGIVKSVQAN